MRDSPLDVHPNAEGLRAYLERVLPGSSLASAEVDTAYQPLVLLQTSHIMAAFAFPNGDLGKTYDALYGRFKRYYAERQSQWRDLDLAFVFCVPPDTPQLERFCSKIETDVYFCRKFVIPFGPRLDASLARLPFIPLAPIGGRPWRPASAQTLLKQCGVPATLAKYLVVQAQRSPEGIVEDCISGTFGEPRGLTAVANANTPVMEADLATEPVKLETVEIKNFRAYRKPQTFAIGADVTVLYGPNGFGKTSFFDAIDFAVTGGIGRLRSSSEAHFERTARHLDSKAEESAVSLLLLCNGAARKLKRTVGDPKRALLDGRTTDRKTILAEVTGRNISAADRVENFVSLFRATHLFSQEQQELAKGFEDDCQLSERVVSRMLAFEDYSNALNKTAKVRGVMQAAISGAEKDIRELSEQIADETRELDRLAKVAQVLANPQALDAEIASVRDKLGEAGIHITAEESDLATVRGWRVSLEARHAESEAPIARLSGLAKDAADLPQVVAEVAGLQLRLSDKEQALSTVKENQRAAETELHRAQQRLAETTAKRAEVQTRAELLERIDFAARRYRQLLDRRHQVNEELKHTTATLAQHSASEKKAAASLRAEENLSEQAQQRLATKRAELVALQSLTENAAAWDANRARLSNVAVLEQEAAKSLESLRGEERELALQVSELEAEEALLSDLISGVDRNQSQLKRLLSQLQGHVQNSICPLCGHDHGSKDELLSCIQRQVATDAASSTRVELTRLREKLSQLTGRVTDNRHKQQVADAHLVSLRSGRARLSADLANLADSASKLGIVIETSSPIPTGELQTRHNRVQQEIEGLKRESQAADSRLAAARAAVAETRSLVATAESDVASRTASLADLEKELSRLRHDAGSAQVSLDTEPAKLMELQRLNLRDLNGLDTEVGKAEADAAQQRQRVSALSQESNSITAQATALRAQLADLEGVVAQITARLRESNLPSDADENTIRGLIAEESRAQARLMALRDSVSNLELAIDAATTAAALTRLRQSVRNKERAVANAKLRRDQHGPWLAYFGEVTRLLASEQEEAIANFTREYGPRTSVIQQRLRSVYGFDEVEVRGHGAAISVRVKRRGEELRPTDYLSQSQLQTLLLGLFLTACISQTWSALSPVFLDDPVTHFDDLNTYAFLDLILGLLESDAGKRQFVISTCDERLLQLARRKFRHLGERARFYRFSAIGAEGPIVEEIGPS